MASPCASKARPASTFAVQHSLTATGIRQSNGEPGPVHCGIASRGRASAVVGVLVVMVWYVIEGWRVCLPHVPSSYCSAHTWRGVRVSHGSGHATTNNPIAALALLGQREHARAGRGDARLWGGATACAGSPLPS